MACHSDIKIHWRNRELYLNNLIRLKTNLKQQQNSCSIIPEQPPNSNYLHSQKEK